MCACDLLVFFLNTDGPEMLLFVMKWPVIHGPMEQSYPINKGILMTRTLKTRTTHPKFNGLQTWVPTSNGML